MEKETKFNIQTLEFEQSRVPRIIEKLNKDYVYFGEDNLYPQYLLGLFYKSSKNAAILSAIADMIKGENFITDGKSESLLKFFENENNKESLYDILPKISFDLTIYGAFALNVIFSNDGKSIAQIKYVDVKKVRVEKQEEEEDFDYYYISNDWSNTRKIINIPERIAGFNPRNKAEKSQLFYVTKYRPGLDFYGLPHYISAVNWIELDYEVSNFHLQSTLNGYMPGMIINFATGIPTKDEQKAAKKQLDDNFKGTNQAGKTILTFSEGSDQAVQVTPIELNSSDNRFKDLEAQIIQNILIANKATSPSLFGVQTEGKLGGRDELLEAFEMYNLTVIQSMQDVIISALEKLSEYNGITDEIEIERYKIFEEIDKQENNNQQIIN